MMEDVDVIALARNSLRRPRAQAIGQLEIYILPVNGWAIARLGLAYDNTEEAFA